jgi:hypothetical protein
MESCEQPLAVLGNPHSVQEWASACAQLKAVFDKMGEDSKAELFSGDVCIPALLQAILRDSARADDRAAVQAAASAALNALIAGLPQAQKLSLLSGGKGVVRALLIVLGNGESKAAWGFACRCFWSLFVGVPADAKQPLLQEGAGITEAIVGVLQSDHASAWMGASGAMSSLLSGLTALAVKQSLLAGDIGVVPALLRVLGDDKGRASWENACRCFSTIFADLPSEARVALLGDGRGIVEAIVAVLESDQAGAWAGAAVALNSFLSGLALASKLTLLRGDKGVVKALLRVLRDGYGKSAWGSVGLCFRNLLLGTPVDARLPLLSDGRGIVEALVGVLDGEEAAAWDGAVGALKTIPFQLPVDVKQSLLGDEKGVMRALLRVLSDAKGKPAWDGACHCINNIVIGLSASVKEVLLHDGRGVVRAVVGALLNDQTDSFLGVGWAVNNLLSDLTASSKESLLTYAITDQQSITRVLLHVMGQTDNHGAWGGACQGIKALLNGIPSASKSKFLSTQPQLVETIISRLEDAAAHSCWPGAIGLLKQMVHEENSLAHINFCSLDFLRTDRGLLAELARSTGGFSNEADNKCFESICNAFVELSLTSNSFFVALSLEMLKLFCDAARMCSHDPSLRSFGCSLSNWSENLPFCSTLADTKCHEYLLSKIVGMTADHADWNDAYSVPTRFLSVIVNMSRNEALLVDLKRCRVIEILTPFATPTCAAQLRVLMALSYIIGCKEINGNDGSGKTALTQLANSVSIGKIIDCLENTLNLTGGPGYSFGSLILPAILQVTRDGVCQV